MLGLLAASFMTATRTDRAEPPRAGVAGGVSRKRWLGMRAWWFRMGLFRRS